MKEKKVIFKISVALFICAAMLLTITTYINFKDGNGSLASSQIKNRIIKCDWRSFMDLDELINKSNIIIVGNVLENKNSRKVFDKIQIDQDSTTQVKKMAEEAQKFSYRIITDSKVKIESVLKGNFSINDEINVSQMGGIYDNEKHIVEDVEIFKVGNRYLLFIADDSKIKPDVPFITLNPFDGEVPLDKNKVHSKRDSIIFKDEADLNKLIDKIQKITEKK